MADLNLCRVLELDDGGSIRGGLHRFPGEHVSVEMQLLEGGACDVPGSGRSREVRLYDIPYVRICQGTR